MLEFGQLINNFGSQLTHTRRNVTSTENVNETTSCVSYLTI